MNVIDIAGTGIVRVDLMWHNIECEIDIIGNKVLDPPKEFAVLALPELLQERVNILKLLDKGGIPDFGRRVGKEVFHIHVTKEEWSTLQQQLIKEAL